jgi:hypothetical protein
LNHDKPGRECQRLSLCHFVTADAGFWFALVTALLTTAICSESAFLATRGFWFFGNLFRFFETHFWGTELRRSITRLQLRASATLHRATNPIV